MSTPQLALATEFLNGDLYLLSHSLPLPGGGSHYGIVRIDPISGTSSLFYTATGTLSTALTYDPFRNLLVFVHGDGRILGLDADGVETVLLTPPAAPHTLAARGDGIIYMQVGFVFHYLDASNVQQPLLDVPGTGTFNLAPGGAVAEMRYDDATSSLITVSAGALVPVCPDWMQVCAGRIPLTPSGTQVSGAMLGAQADVAISSGTELIVGTGQRNDGKVAIIVDTNTNASENRMLLLDPPTMAITFFASNGGYTGAAAISAGTYSNVRNQDAILDSFNDGLRAFSAGGSGTGTVFSTDASGYGVSSAGGHSELARMVEIDGATVTGIAPPSLRPELELFPPYPNPFNPIGQVAFTAPRGSDTRLSVYDVQGREIAVLFEGPATGDEQRLRWNAGEFASGVYFLRLSGGGVETTRKVILLK